MTNGVFRLRRFFILWGLAFFLLLPSPAFAVPVQAVTGDSGVTAWLVEDHSLPIISLSFTFRGGAAFDPPEKPGLANFLSSLLDEGAGDLDATAFQERLAAHSIRLRFAASHDEFSGVLQTLSGNRAMAFDLLRLALTAPRFDPPAVERMRGEIQAALVLEKKDPRQLAEERWYAETFPGHPYGRSVTGTASSIAAIDPDDLRQFATRNLTRDRLHIGVAGDIDAASLKRLLDETFGPLPAAAADAEIPDAAVPVAPAMMVIERSFPQSSVVFGQGGVARDDPDFYAAYLLNHILGGGGFTSRLTREVREKRGLTYGVYSYLLPLSHAPLWMGSVATANASVAETVSAIRDEWVRLHEGGVTEEELADAKTYLVGSFPLRLDSTREIAAMLLMMQMDKLGIDYLERRNDLINDVTLSQVNGVAKRVLNPTALRWVVVGAGVPDGFAGPKTPQP